LSTEGLSAELWDLADSQPFLFQSASFCLLKWGCTRTFDRCISIGSCKPSGFSNLLAKGNDLCKLKVSFHLAQIVLMNVDEDKRAERSGNMRKGFTVLRFPTPSLSILS